jgi:histone deacetylase 1/2
LCYSTSTPNPTPYSNTGIINDSDYVPILTDVVVPSVLPISVTGTASNTPPQNTHSMTTRAKAGVFKPKTYTVAVPGSYDPTIEPKTTKEALSKPEWLNAMKLEYDALSLNNTWTPVDPPAGCKPIGYKWVFKSKFNVDGSFQQHKARLVAKGFHPRAGFDFHETLNPVIKPATMPVVVSLALSAYWLIRQIDVNNSFLNDELNETVYMVQLPGFSSAQKGKVCKLHKAIYGMKQAPRSWFHKLCLTLMKLGFTQAKSDSSLFTRFNTKSTLFVFIYVDDIIITGSSSTNIQSLISLLNSFFSLIDLGPLHYFLGVDVLHQQDGRLVCPNQSIFRNCYIKLR